MNLAGTTIKKTASIIVACAIALLLAGQPAYSVTVTVLDENFNDVTGLGTAGATRTIANILANDPGQLPASTQWTSTNLSSGVQNPSNINVRRADNTINTSTLTNGFDSFFTPISATNKFLVIGDNSGVIADAPAGGMMTVLLPFQIPGSAKSISVGFDYIFDGVDTNASAGDLFSVYLTDMFNTFPLLSITSPDRASGSSGNIAQGTFSGSWLVGDLPGYDLYLAFRLDERAANTNTAVGIDNVRVTAVVPEPSTILLLGSGILALGFYGARRRRGM